MYKLFFGTLGVFAAFSAGAAHAGPLGPVKVNAADNIFGAGQTSAPGGGNVPTGIITLQPGDQCVRIKKVQGSLPCTSAEGCITLDGRTNLNDPDGRGGYYPAVSNTGSALISGITTPGDGSLIGVFLPAGGPAGPVPPALNFTTGKDVAFHHLAPLLDQTFFAGDGKTGDGTGAVQRFIVPSGAASLVFGISDNCTGPGPGSPGCYFDNAGSYKVFYTLSQTSCPQDGDS
jgi:hypothetical protein